MTINDYRELLVVADRFCLPQLISVCESAITEKIYTEIRKKRLNSAKCNDVINLLLTGQVGVWISCDSTNGSIQEMFPNHTYISLDPCKFWSLSPLIMVCASIPVKDRFETHLGISTPDFKWQGWSKAFLGSEIFDCRIFWGRKIWQVFFGWLDLCTRDFFGYSEQSEDHDSACLSQPRCSLI